MGGVEEARTTPQGPKLVCGCSLHVWLATRTNLPCPLWPLSRQLDTQIVGFPQRLLHKRPRYFKGLSNGQPSKGSGHRLAWQHPPIRSDSNPNNNVSPGLRPPPTPPLADMPRPVLGFRSVLECLSCDLRASCKTQIPGLQ